MLKKEFLSKLKEMRHPTIREFYPDDNDGLLSTCWIIEDESDWRKKFVVPSVRLTKKNYGERIYEKHIQSFYNREQYFRDLYSRWLITYAKANTIQSSRLKGEK